MEETELIYFMLEHLSSSATEGSVEVEKDLIRHKNMAAVRMQLHFFLTWFVGIKK